MTKKLWCGRLARCATGIPSLRPGQALPLHSHGQDGRATKVIRYCILDGGKLRRSLTICAGCQSFPQ
jgi:hypothetical protein